MSEAPEEKPREKKERRPSSGSRRSKRPPTEESAAPKLLDGLANGVHANHEEAPPPAPPALGPQASSRGAVPVGRSLEISTTADVCMEALVDKLKLLDYEREFCRKKKPYRKPLNRLYFAVPDNSTAGNSQFFYFTCLATWLINLVGIELPMPKEFDDPNATCANILSSCKKLGFASPAYHPSKLTQGHGREICGVLDGLVDYVLERRNFTYKRPMHLPDTYGGADENDVDDDEAAAAGEQEEQATSFELPKYLEEDEEEAFMQTAADLGHTFKGGDGMGTLRSQTEDKALVASKVDPTAWRMEVERVAPRLRITLNANAKDWRSHLEEVQSHCKDISMTWPDSRAALERLRGELELSLDKLVTREKFLNDQFDTLMSQYRAARSQMQGVQAQYNARTEAISDRNSELHRITEQLAEMKAIMDSHSTNIADATPVMRIKGAIKKLQEELAEAEVRIGVVSHTLLQLSIKNKRLLQSHPTGPMPSDEED
ncbi:intra-flagellar transport protein 57-domain-containing protein [Dunaliella salina]|uniref:Intra-flagellar transport protein 57-domain-containing protein n=1 Tax=Dunaliella salina TaxID=3046 RepID=A0ABQ7G0U2_DUNSA|nr:intra-flagellar transport protein 57-domain-containing protein [Dunaliella salina]|eukprot:KAF5828216.1 intra-flagellar transport protein 57-domain-containing protein [Dunaliella salina]